MLSFFFFALGVWIGWYARGSKVAAWVKRQIDKFEE